MIVNDDTNVSTNPPAVEGQEGEQAAPAAEETTPTGEGETPTT